MSIRRWLWFIFTALVSGALLATAGAMIALSASWDSADPVAAISADEDILKWGRPALDLGANSASVVWAGSTITPGIYTAQRVGGAWVKDFMSATLTAWAPDIAASGEKTIKAWMHGGEHLNPAEPWSLVVQVGNGAVETIATDLYGEGLPSVAIGDRGFHLVCAATDAKSATGAFYPDLYYTYRAFDATGWSPLQVVVSHDAVLAENAIAGGVENARVALTGSTIHVVWEQKQIVFAGSPQLEHSIWHIAGTLIGGDVDWGTPTRLSPADQRITARPSLAAGEDGRVFVAWTELVGLRGNPEAQHVHYRALDDAEWMPLNPPGQPIRVNGRLPNKAAVAIAVHDDVVCAVWHGYYDGDPDTLEDIHLRCSHDGGETWGTPMIVSESGGSLSSIFPTLGFDDRGRVHVTWTDYLLEKTGFVPYQVLYRRGEVWEGGLVFLPLVKRSP
ncbi:MAG: sialidase family protein [Anaerolineae bacterium]